jgi:secondary thiamine-phosphate synthase enzyme
LPRRAGVHTLDIMRLMPLVTETVETSARTQMIDVTQRVIKQMHAHRVTDGLACIFVPHTTAGVIIQENGDPDTQHDLLKKLESLVPPMETYYQHDEGNSDAHVKATITGSSVVVPVDKGRLVLGRWQAIYFVEFDGPRERRLTIKFLTTGNDLD